MDENNQNNSNTGVRFEEDFRVASPTYSQEKTSKFAEIIMNLSGGLVKNEKQASIVALSLAILILLISLIIFFRSGDDRDLAVPAGEGDLSSIAP